MLDANGEELACVRPHDCASDRSDAWAALFTLTALEIIPWHRQCRVHLYPAFALHAGTGAANWARESTPRKRPSLSCPAQPEATLEIL
jgi:hypothetical protein